MKTKLDEKLEINAQFEILDSSPNINMPVHVRDKNDKKESKGGIVQAISNFLEPIISEKPDTLKDFFPEDDRKVHKLEAMEQQRLAKAESDMREQMEDKFKRRVMPYFYCD